MTDWRQQAECLDTDPDLWFPLPGTTSAEARAICASCPVREECLNDALETGEAFGIRGGYTALQRRAIARERQRFVA